MALKKKVELLKKPLKQPISLRDRTDIVWRNFIFFVILFILSIVLYLLSSNEFIKNFFFVILIVFGAWAFAFLIIFVVLLILKSGSRKKRAK